MYKEGIKWAAGQMHDGVLPKDGRKASVLLVQIGANVFKSTMSMKVCEFEQELSEGTAVQTPIRSGKPPRIPYRYEIQLADFVAKLRALKLRAGKSLTVVVHYIDSVNIWPGSC